MLSWKTKIRSMPANAAKTLEERRAFNDTAVALANNRVGLADTIRLAAHDAFGEELSGGFIVPRMFSSDLIVLYKRLDAAKLDFFRELPEKKQRGKNKEYDMLTSKMEGMVKLCDEILENKDLQSILEHPKEVQRIALATAGSSEVSLYGRLRSVLRLTKGALSIGAVAAIVYFVYLWASGKRPTVVSCQVQWYPETVSGESQGSRFRVHGAGGSQGLGRVGLYVYATTRGTNNAWESTSAFRDAAKLPRATPTPT